MLGSSFISRVGSGGLRPACVFLLLLPPVAAPAALRAQTPELAVQYTGKLFGYYRIEPVETGADGAPIDRLTAVASFLKYRSSASPLLLGMGDNFAPEFGASIQQEFRTRTGHGPCEAPAAGGPPTSDAGPTDWHRSAPEALYKSESRMPPLADCDNVTRFLMTAGYRAIVPGREDFIYSATWLRRIAFLLWGASQDPAGAEKNPIAQSGGAWKSGPIASTDGKLHLLAANLRVKVSASSCPLLFARDLAATGHPCLPDDSSTTQEMDWFRRLDDTLGEYGIEDSINRQAAGNMEFRMQTVINEVTVLSTLLKGYGCTKAPDELAFFSKPAQGNGSPYAFDPKTGALVLRDKSKDLADPKAGTPQSRSGKELLDAVRAGSGSIVCNAPGERSGADVTATLQSLVHATLDSITAALNTPQEAAAAGKAPAIPNILVGSAVRRDAVDLFLNLIYAEQKDAGFTILELPSHKHALIIGVAGQETMQQISRDNATIYPDAQDGPNCSPVPVDPATPGAKKPDPVCKLKQALNAEKNKEAKEKKEIDPFTRIAGFNLEVGDPHLAVTAILRAAWDARARMLKTDPAPLFDSVIVMAQMPSTEAEELAERVRADIETSYERKHELGNADKPSIDLVLAEAQEGHETPNLELRTAPGERAAVLVPPDASGLWQEDAAYSISTAALSDHTEAAHPQLSRLLVNTYARAPGTKEPPVPVNSAVRCPFTPNPSGVTQGAAANTLHECQTAASLLKDELDQEWARDRSKPAAPSTPPTGLTTELNTGLGTDLDALWAKCTVAENGRQYDDLSCQNSVLMNYLLRQLRRSSNADVVLLERRDFYFQYLGTGYGDYAICKQWADEETLVVSQAQAMPSQFRNFYENYCHLKVALDRVLWKGDYSQRVMVDGATLTTLIKTAQQQTTEEQSLQARDLYEELLMTYGIVTAPARNLVTASSGPNTFSLPGSDGCADSGSKSNAADAATSPYCIDGQPILSDRAYWLATSDQLAEDTTLYAPLGALTGKPNHYAAPTGKLFLTSEIADEVFRHSQPPVLLAAASAGGTAGTSQTASPAEADLAAVETMQQNRNLLQLDFSKLVAGYTFTRPSLSDANLATDYSGVSNTQAATPHSQELDLETASRLSSAPAFRRLALGAQTDAEYDRRVLGNLTGNPDTATYSANSYSVGGFAQVAIHSHLIPGLAARGVNRSTRNLPRLFVVVAPYQYQRQLTGAFLNFAFFTPPSTSNSQQQVTVHVPTAMGFSQRVGFRYEFAGAWRWTPDPGSYIELGPEYAEQNNVLSAIRMPQISSAALCSVAATQSIQTCVKNAYKAAGVPLNASSMLIPATQTLHTGGLYWMVHVQKVLDKQKRYSASFDTQGDSFLLPGVTLTTQTRYAFSTKLALNFKIAGNFSLAPTWTDFYFENQGISAQRTSLVTNTFTMTAKWFFARDAQVPWRKQLWFMGPASSDQTGSARVK